MKNYSPIEHIIYLLLLAAVVAACSSGKPVKNPAQPGSPADGNDLSRESFERVIQGAPAWVNKGSRLLNTQNGRLFHGVAVAAPMGDMALQKAVADDRARSEVARVLSACADALAADYIASIRSPEPGAKGKQAGSPPVSDVAILSQMRNSTKPGFESIRIIGSWRDPKSGDIWSIAELEFRQVKNSVAVTDMDPDLKRFIETDADRVFDRKAAEAASASSAAAR